MTKRKVLLFAALVACFALLLAISAFAANEPVTYKVQGSGGAIIERTTEVGKLFNVVSTNNDRVIMGLNSTVDGFASNKIVEVHVPNGIAEVNISLENSAVKTIVFDYYAKVKVTNLKGLKNLQKIEVQGVEANVTFGAGCAPSTLTEIAVTAPRATLVFDSNAFKDIASLKTLNFGHCADPEKPSSFQFGASCFQNTGIENLVLDDPWATYSFNGSNTFSNNAKLKTVALGEGIKTIGSNTFDYCSALEFVYAKAVTNFPDYTFRVTANTEKSQLKVYIHTEQKVTMGTSAFSGRSTKGVIVCALETSVTAFSSCKYELHYGVPHLYKESSETPTCYTTYVTDCTCGRVGNAYYKLYASGASVKNVRLVAGPNPSVPHTFTGAYKLEYPNGIEEKGLVELKCGVCGTLEGCERVAAPVVEFQGYSVSETGTRAMVMGVRFNYSTLKQYEEINGEKLEYGMVLAGAGALNGNLPIKEDGSAYSSNVYLHKMSSLGLYESTLKLANVKDSMVDTELYMSAYIKVGKRIIYLQGDGEAKMPMTITYSQISK